MHYAWEGVGLCCYRAQSCRLEGNGALPNLPQAKLQTRRKMGFQQSRQDPHCLSSVEAPAGAGIGAGVSTVSLVKADFLGDRQAVGCGRVAGITNLPICWMELFDFQITW